jgi:hypothetical protein
MLASRAQARNDTVFEAKLAAGVSTSRERVSCSVMNDLQIGTWISYILACGELLRASNPLATSTWTSRKTIEWAEIHEGNRIN